MDITLERILSLIPRNQNGKYVHGAKKKFAEQIGYSGGEIISMWENGDSQSYNGKIHEIAAVHNVSVEWLQGKIDDPAPGAQKETSPAISGEERLDRELVSRLCKLTPAELEKVDAFVQGILAAR